MPKSQFVENWEITHYKKQANKVYTSALVLITILNLIFFFFESYVFVLVNFISIISCVICLFINKKEMYGTASFIFITSSSLVTSFHSIYFGFLSSFLSYAFLITSLTIFTNWRRLFKLYMMLFIGALYIIRGILTYQVGPLKEINIIAQSTFFVINMSFVMATVARNVAFFFNTTKEAHEKLAELATTDFLTELPNRTSLIYKYEKTLHEKQTGIGFMMINTDDFKMING